MRSLLFVPAHKRDLIEKALETEASAIIFDLEDSCPAKYREEGIANIKEYSGKTTSIVRISDLRQTKQVGRVDYIMYPKAEDFVWTDIDRFVPAILLVETARGIMNLNRNVYNWHSRVAGVAFGNEDYFADTGCNDYSFAEAMVVNCAKAHDKFAIDTVHVNVHDLSNLEYMCRRAYKLGFDGKLCIHPKEVPIVNKHFTPSLEDYEHACRVTELYDRAEAEGSGVAILDGVYVAPPMVRRAEKIIAKYEKYG